MPILEDVRGNCNKVLPYMNAPQSEYLPEFIANEKIGPVEASNVMWLYDSLIADLDYGKTIVELQTKNPIYLINVLEDLHLPYNKINKDKFIVFADQETRDKYNFLQDALRRGWLFDEKEKYKEQDFIIELQIMKGNPRCCAETYADHIYDIRAGMLERHPYYQGSLENAMKIAGKKPVNIRDITIMIETGRVYPYEFTMRNDDLLPHDIECEAALEACRERRESLEILERGVARRTGKRSEIIKKMREDRITKDAAILLRALSNMN